jgi:hypothetical protein
VQTKLLFFITLCVLVLPNVSAEVFRWTDANGQVHFSDHARAPSAAKEVEIDTSKMNITSELSSPEQLQRQAEDLDALRQQKLEQWQSKRKDQPTKDDWCNWARSYLQTIVGRVVFLDDNNQAVKVSEKERKERAQKLAKEIEKRC